jgi:hypothetical protein
MHQYEENFPHSALSKPDYTEILIGTLNGKIHFRFSLVYVSRSGCLHQNEGQNKEIPQ